MQEWSVGVQCRRAAQECRATTTCPCLAACSVFVAHVQGHHGADIRAVAEHCVLELLLMILPAGQINSWQAWQGTIEAQQCLEAGLPFLCDVSLLWRFCCWISCSKYFCLSLNDIRWIWIGAS